MATVKPLSKRYHINPETGLPRLCVAKRKCRFGSDAVHYPSELDASLAYERMMTRYEAREAQRPRGEVKPLDSDWIEDGNIINLKPGKYFLGDPYLTVAPGDQAGWTDIIDGIGDQYGWEAEVASPAEEKAVAVGALYNGEPIVALKAWHGEGLHWSVGPTRRLPSETGLMGFVTEATLREAGLTLEEAEKRKLGMAVEVDKPTSVWRDEHGVIIVGGKLVIFHNDIVQTSWFESLSAADGINNKVPTKETYEFVMEKAQQWAENPYTAR